MRIATRLALLVCLTVLVAFDLHAQLSPEVASRVDAIAGKALAESGAPSVSIAIVKDGKIAYVHAYGNGCVDPPTPARPGMRYKIGSVSKQFMAMSILLLVQEGKLLLDDPVGRYLPHLTRANDITIRQLPSHTSGYQDYYPLDYVAPFMLQPVTPDEILDRWAGKPLDFEPGTQWQYSNTNFVVAGRILEHVTGMAILTRSSKELRMMVCQPPPESTGRAGEPLEKCRLALVFRLHRGCRQDDVRIQASVARTCFLGPRFVPHGQGKAADLQNRSALHFLFAPDAGEDLLDLLLFTLDRALESRNLLLVALDLRHDLLLHLQRRQGDLKLG